MERKKERKKGCVNMCIDKRVVRLEIFLICKYENECEFALKETSEPTQLQIS